jgi:hypothetical protein
MPHKKKLVIRRGEYLQTIAKLPESEVRHEPMYFVQLRNALVVFHVEDEVRTFIGSNIGVRLRATRDGKGSYVMENGIVIDPAFIRHAYSTIFGLTPQNIQLI